MEIKYLPEAACVRRQRTVVLSYQKADPRKERTFRETRMRGIRRVASFLPNMASADMRVRAKPGIGTLRQATDTPAMRKLGRRAAMGREDDC